MTAPPLICPTRPFNLQKRLWPLHSEGRLQLGITFTQKYRLIDLIVHSLIISTRHKNVRVDRVAILYAIYDPTTRVDPASLMFSLILAASQDTSSSGTLSYRVLIIQLC